MKVVMTLVVRNEDDIVRDHLRFHLNAGVDMVLVTDHASEDGTPEILAEFERAGVVRILREPAGPFRQREWQSRMARLAATEHGADWIINSDADEFWWPRGGSLQDVLSAIPDRYGILGSLVRHFVPVADGDGPFHTRLQFRLTPQAPINDPSSPWRPFRKILHRPDPGAELIEGSHGLRGSSLVPMRGWYPIECLHFPLRSVRQTEQKGLAWETAVTKFYNGRSVGRSAGTVYHALQHRAATAGQADDYFDRLALTPQEIEVGLERGLLTRDTRVHDALRVLGELGGVPERHVSPLRFPVPSTVDVAQFATDAAVLAEADVIRTQRWLDGLEQRMAAMERMPVLRAERLARRMLRRLRGTRS